MKTLRRRFATDDDGDRLQSGGKITVYEVAPAM